MLLNRNSDFCKKTWISPNFGRSQHLPSHNCCSINHHFGWSINRIHQYCQIFVNLNKFNFFCFMNETISTWTSVQCTEWSKTSSALYKSASRPQFLYKACLRLAYVQNWGLEALLDKPRWFDHFVHCIGFLYFRGKLHVTGQQSYKARRLNKALQASSFEEGCVISIIAEYCFV